jgi:hypothetical protein
MGNPVSRVYIREPRLNPRDAASLLFEVALLISMVRSTKQLRTFLYSTGAYLVVAIGVMCAIFLLPMSNATALGNLARDAGRMAGAVTAILYSAKTRERPPRSVYVLGAGAIVLLIGLALALSI